MKKAILTKIAFVLFVLLLIFAFGGSTVFAVSQPIIIVGSVEGRTGDIVSVPIAVENNPGIVALRVFVKYDTEALQLTDVQDGMVFPVGKSTFGGRLQAIPYTMLWVDGTEKTNNTSNGILATLTFTILDSAKAGNKPITVTYDCKSTFNVDLVEVPFTMQNGSVTVTEEEQLYTATFTVDGTAISTKQYHAGDTIVKPTDPVKDGYTFKGWTPAVPVTMPEKDMTFEAVFEKIPEKPAAVTGVTLDDLTLYYKDGGTLPMKVETQGEPNYGVAYTVVNPKILSVGEDGTVNTLHWGKTDIKVTVTDENGNSFTDTCTVQAKCRVWQWLIIIFLFGWIWY